MSQQTSSRLLYVNNLRIILITLIIMLHTAITYGAAGSWYYSDPNSETLSTIALTLFNAVVQSFALGFFFMISGYFTPGSYARKGARAYLVDRLVRLGIPLAVYFFVISPVMENLLYAVFLGQSVPFSSLFGTGPLWFVETLLIFAIAYHVWPWIRSREVQEMNAPESRDVLKYVLGLSFANFVARAWMPVGESFSNLQFGYFPGYIALFCVGVIAYRNNWFANFKESVGRQWLKVALVGIPLFPIVVLLAGATDNVTPFMGGLTWQSIVYSTWDAFVGTGLVTGLFVIFRKRFDSQSGFAKLLADNVYAAFIIHAPVLVFFAYAVRGIVLYPLLKFALAAIAVMSLCFLISHFVVRRIPYAKKVL